MRIRAATAWKENLHWLNETNFNRLKAAGLISSDNIKKAVNGIARKVHVRKGINYNTISPKDISYYFPNITQLAKAYPQYDKKALANAIKPHRDSYGRISMNLAQLKARIQADVIPEHLHNDLMHHEYQEALIMQNISKGKQPFKRFIGHNSVTVPVNERKMFNQTGGLRTRPSLNKLRTDNLSHLRQENKVERDYIVKPTSIRQRLRNFNYKKIAREAYRHKDDTNNLQ